MKRRDAMKVVASAVAVAASGVGTTAAQAQPVQEIKLAPHKCVPFHSKHYARTQEHLKASKRFPKLDDAVVPPEEKKLWQYWANRVRSASSAEENPDKLLVIDGLSYGQGHFTAMPASPVLAFQQGRFGRVLLTRNNVGDSVTGWEHESIDFIHCFDSGYYIFLLGHTRGGLSTGMRVEMLEAIRDHRDDLLTPKERRFFTFLRAARDGKMTQEIWNGGVAHFAGSAPWGEGMGGAQVAGAQPGIGSGSEVVEFDGSVRGALDLGITMLQLGHHFNYTRAVGVAEGSADGWNKMISEYRQGKRVPQGARAYSETQNPPASLKLNVASTVTPPPSPPPADADWTCPSWFGWATLDREAYPERAPWFPKVGQQVVYRKPGSLEVAWDEIGDFDSLQARIDWANQNVPVKVAGRPYGVDFYTALQASPRLGAQLARMEAATRQVALSKPTAYKTYGAYESELTSCVLALDSGYYAFVPTDAPAAVKAGVRPEAIKALREHNDGALNASELEHVKFIRAVRDGSMTDEIWDKAARKLDARRGVYDYAQLVCGRNIAHLFMWMTGVPDMKHADFDKMLGTLKA